MIDNQDLRYFQEKQILLASIDIGTNSTHLLIAEINLDLKSFSIKFTDKSTTRLGERDDEGNLTEESIQRALVTLKRFKEYCKSNGVKQIVSAATSAVREAPNGQDFIRRVFDETDIKIELISGSEEARLIYLGVLSGMAFEDKSYVIIDIGGGSTELILADKKDAIALTSSRVGAVRLKNDFLNKDPINSERSKFLKTFIQGSLEPSVQKIKRRSKEDKPLNMIATSGTATSLGNLIIDDLGESKQKIHGYKFKKENLQNVLGKLLKMPVLEIKKIPSLSERRAEIIIPGALILNTAMEMLNFNELTISERALREGLVVDWMLRKGIIKNEFFIQSNIRKTTIVHQASKFGVDKKRAEKVIDIAFQIYDQTKNIFHNDNDSKAKELLWAASNLYNCGKFVNISSYHKHSWYLIKNCELLGYSEAETNIIAAIARYHRKTLPKKRHESWQNLISKENKKIVLEMSLILRLAASLDQRPEKVISQVQIKLQENLLTFEIMPSNRNHDLLLEKWNLGLCRNAIKELKNLDLKVI
ncbi:Ppx/GppA phosphatase family protein [Prochlorococcus marinus]|uniref:Ppx/GppA phosphatase family protein n=1 Tax=Prochlorococcus marinus TaxID=1219 RepID=UPI001ADB9C6D|nr:Ppx/GppA phosphatase family protein [Prochlorococcus marinus]MBO8220533.1 Ppx/GppA family phosphatase [Prochlorococcus marinus CUG1417]MBW3075163.1 exopolyphosphatase [Prochlorococcus marinus str. MU1417]